jgi:nitrogen fixation/metabolism regulation signal transduction histidine kinase
MLMNWSHIQDEVSSYGVRQLLAENGANGSGTAGAGQLMGEGVYQSSYAWVWQSDADTILAHLYPELYGKKVSEPPIGLPQMVSAARAGSFGMYPDYSFRGVEKRAAFKHCRGPEQGGFGWVVGVGVDMADIVAPVRDLSRVLYSATAIALSIAILLTVFIARRTTRPILALRKHTERVAAGDLDARVEVRGNDELADLGRAFNQMTAELKENRAQLVRTEKDAAWREMARQVAHEIKNPLTPIALSVSLLKRAVRENSSEKDAILERTMDLIERQVEQMRGITKDFYAFAGEHKEPRPFDPTPVVSEVLALHAAWAEQLGVRQAASGSGATLFGDPDELRRALINLTSNALESMVEGGHLEVTMRADAEQVILEVVDDGPGISSEAADKLFEPYFTTRSSGTGLGLAIVRRIVEDMGGSVSLSNREDGPGARACIVLPRHG